MTLQEFNISWIKCLKRNLKQTLHNMSCKTAMITSHSTVEKCSGAIMETTEETPLEVLSRAATMVQENQHAALVEETNKQIHKQTNKWKRDRRRLPEYSRKSDPKVPETLGVEPSSPEASISNGNSPLGNLNGVPAKREHDPNTNGVETPLDMTIRQRGLPPSYAQTISSPSFKSSYRPTVIHNGIPPVLNTRDELPSGISMCDPVIEEHFRRSLGNDYHTLFQNNNPSKEKELPPPKSPPKASTNIIEFMNDPCPSVDDHFAKALGETWKKLNQKEEIQTRENENNLVFAKN